MPRANPKNWTVAEADAAAARYQRTLQLEHYVEGTDQSTQRAITLASLEVLRTRRPRVQVFNELLVMYFRKGRLHYVVPDNMARECDAPPVSKSSFSVEIEPVPPFWVMEYVSPSSVRKDFRDSFAKYEQELKVPYYLLFRPDRQELRLHRHDGTAYQLVPPNAAGRREIPEWEVEVATVDGWVRFWHQGELLALPTELVAEVGRYKRLVDEAETGKREAELAVRQAEAGKREAEARAVAAEEENARLRALLERLQGGTA